MVIVGCLDTQSFQICVKVYFSLPICRLWSIEQFWFECQDSRLKKNIFFALFPKWPKSELCFFNSVLVFPQMLFHWQPTEDPDCFLNQRPLASPVLLVGDGNCLLCIGTMPVFSFEKADFAKGIMYLMAYYYALHLTYPKCLSTVLSVLQTEVLHDAMHDGDSTHAYRKSLAEWKDYLNQWVLQTFNLAVRGCCLRGDFVWGWFGAVLVACLVLFGSQKSPLYILTSVNGVPYCSSFGTLWYARLPLSGLGQYSVTQMLLRFFKDANRWCR